MIDEHLGYVSDHLRVEAYRSAIANVNPRGWTVVDLGCGTGILGLMCLRAGASRVYAIDSTPMIALARESFSRSGFRDRAVCIAERSTRATVPERADLVICDQVGYFGFDAGIVECSADARRRFLKPGGTMIPGRMQLHLAGVCSDAAYRPVCGWAAGAVPGELRWILDRAANTKYPVRFRGEDLITPPAMLGTIDLDAETSDLLTWSARLRVDRDATLHGLAGWFECELAPGVWMTNSPLSDSSIERSQAFLPIQEPAQVRAGDTVEVTVHARPQSDVIAWLINLPGGRRFRQSTWQGAPFTQEEIVRSSPHRVPKPGRAGAARAIVLAYCDGYRTVREIEAAILRDHPGLLPSAAEISRFVTHVLSRDTE